MSDKKIMIHIGLMHKSLIPDDCARMTSQARLCIGDGFTAFIMILDDYYVPLCELCADQDDSLTTELRPMTPEDVARVEWANSLGGD